MFENLAIKKARSDGTIQTPWSKKTYSEIFKKKCLKNAEMSQKSASISENHVPLSAMFLINAEGEKK